MYLHIYLIKDGFICQYSTNATSHPFNATELTT